MSVKYEELKARFETNLEDAIRDLIKDYSKKWEAKIKPDRLMLEEVLPSHAIDEEEPTLENTVKTYLQDYKTFINDFKTKRDSRIAIILRKIADELTAK